MTHTCPIPGCTAQTHREVLMCSQHWLMVPKSLRVPVCTTWHALERAVGPRQEVRRRCDAYRAAREAAVRVVADALVPASDTVPERSEVGAGAGRADLSRTRLPNKTPCRGPVL